jgi:cell division protein FtsN
VAETLPSLVPSTAEEEALPPLTAGEQQKIAAETAKERQLGVPAPKTAMPKPPPFEQRVFTDTTPLKKTQVYVQIGAFGEEPRATDQQLALGKLYKTAHISAVEANGKHLLRVRAGPFRSVADAEAALDAIVQGGFPEAQIKVEE